MADNQRQRYSDQIDVIWKWRQSGGHLPLLGRAATESVAARFSADAGTTSHGSDGDVGSAQSARVPRFSDWRQFDRWPANHGGSQPAPKGGIASHANGGEASTNVTNHVARNGGVAAAKDRFARSTDEALRTLRPGEPVRHWSHKLNRAFHERGDPDGDRVAWSK